MADEIAALFGESLFHNKASAEEDGQDDSEGCADFGDDAAENIRLKLNKRVQDAPLAGLLILGQDILTRLLQTYQGIFRLRLGSGVPARIPPMKL